MTMTPVGLTSRWVAANRARETESPEPLFADPFARSLAGEEGFAFLERTDAFRPVPTTSQPDAYLGIRTRFFDDALLEVAREWARAQVVLLAAGMDARAFRLEWPEGATVYEVDREDIFDHKEPVLRDLEAEPRCERRVVVADLGEEWIGPLESAGFDRTRPAAFLAEGLTVYLERPVVEGLLERLASVGRRGSWLGMDVADPELLGSAFVKPMLEELERLGCPWKFGTSEPEALLAEYGWSATAVMPGQPSANFGRWPYPVAPRNMPGIPRSYFVTARRTSD